MSILACLIGILTLMISVVIQVQQMKKAGRTEEEMALAMKNRTLIKKAEKLLKEGDLKKKELQKEKATVSVMEKIKDRKIALTMELEGLNKAKNKSRSDAELQKQVENMRNEIVAIKEERPPLAKRLKDLEDELKRREEKPKPKDSVKVQPRGVLGGAADVIFFVECNSTGIVLLDSQGGQKKISTAAIKTSGGYAKYLDRVKKTEDSMVLFLIRKTGNEAYRWAAGMAELKYKLPIGKLPLPNDGDIDLSLFRDK
ncbi:hypothetical protein N9197_02050 [Akkermansiaceae bacterium]|nr:hypothetical protein [Akkermansiaceae bacterium]MDB4535229.1 hypothetical protein [Akkermansiaceae bacterium]